MLGKRGKKIIAILLIISLVGGGYFYFRSLVERSTGSATGSREIEIELGESVFEIGEKLEEQGIVAGDKIFVYYLLTSGLYKEIKAGEHEIPSKLTIPEIAKIITQKKEEETVQIKITFPEGWSSVDMAARLSNNGLPGDEFLEIVKNPSGEIVGEFSFLESLPLGSSLEGFLFPDTYFFSKDATAESIISKMLNNFDNKLDQQSRSDIKGQEKTVYEIVTMASIIEGEVRSEEDRKVVSGLFWRRLEVNHALQSCATLAYILGENKKQYSFDDTRVASPYNTYINTGLPPGPISNPGILSIQAAVYPTDTEYNYFLSDPETGETVFSVTIDEHNENKVKHGL